MRIGVLVAAGIGVLVAAGMGVFVAAGIGVSVAGGIGVSVAGGGRVGVSIGLWKAAEDDESPAETGSTMLTLNANKAVIRITRGAVFIGLQPPLTDSHEGGLMPPYGSQLPSFKEYTTSSQRKSDSGL